MSRTSPVRTCVGCRKRAAKSDLVRVVVVPSESVGSVVPDPQASRPGRGAHLHPATECLDLAERRRAFPRALRLDGPLNLSVLRLWVAALDQSSAEGIAPPAPAGGIRQTRVEQRLMTSR